ncbi:hypothetical protein [Promicromonospora sukumoe]|uniref:hypothetical protein n=1 Tax=Promicromonospora sukumoe TaxID=88382 RepID=UPI003650636B
MSTSVSRRFLPSARRASASLVASGLVLALTTTAAGAAPAPATTTSSSTTGTAATSLDPTFVQEGLPSQHGGQVVSWGDRIGTGTPQSFSDGVQAVAIDTDDNNLLVLRSDGRVDSHYTGVSPGYSHHLPAPPQGTTYTAVSTGWSGAQLLRSDGIVADMAGQPAMTPPDGLTYTAVSGGFALRSDGVLDPSGDPDATCADVRDPGPGLRYTAVSAHSEKSSWVALRSDGAFVFCRHGISESTATVIDPPTGTRFVGVDMGQSLAFGATEDGQVISSDARRVAVAPPGRSIVSLAAMDFGQGAANLDDGTILSWGLDGLSSALPELPAGRAVFSALSGESGAAPHWAIMVGDPVQVEVSLAPTLPADRPLRVTDPFRAKVTATLADGTPVPGLVETTVSSPDGRVHELEPRAFSSGSVSIWSFPDKHELIGTRTMAVTFAGSPYATTTVETSLDFTEPSPVVVTTSGPTTWHQGAEDTLCVTLATEDGSPLWWAADNQATITVDGDPSKVYKVHQPSYDEPARSCLRDDAWLFPPGNHTVRLDYKGWGERDSASWNGQVVVLPTTATRIDSDLPSSWHYGDMPDFIAVDVLSESRVPAGVARLYLDGATPPWFGYSVRLDGNGHGRISTADEDELVPGTYGVTLSFRADRSFLDSYLQQTVTVKPALFTTATPTITGAPKVGSTLTAVPGSWSPTPTSYLYTWKVDGTPVTGATSSTFTVPASAAGKKITVTVTGLKQYYESAATSAPTATVAPGTFTSPRPTVKGTVKVGRTLTVSPGTWSPAPSSLKYVWKANGTTVSTRSTNTLVVPASAKGKRLTVTVTGSRTGYTPRSVASTATSVVAPATFTAPRPAIKGTKRVGSTLTVVRGTWSPAPSSVKYVWKANGVTISTRTSSKFVVPAKARGKQLTVTVTGTRAGYTTKSVTSYRTTTIR